MKDELHPSLVSLGKWHSEGFGVFECQGDHTLHLFFKGKEIGIYSQTAVTMKILNAACQDWMNQMAGTPVGASSRGHTDGQ